MVDRVIAVAYGTRPEIIKLSPVLHELERARVPFTTIHTGQHYSYRMDRVFMEQLKMPAPDHWLEVGSGSHAAQTARLLDRFEKVLAEEVPLLLLVQGDTNSTLGGALAAAKLGIRVVHLEAGVRTFDRTMPEEVNRVIVDHLADVLLAPTQTAVRNLRVEGIRGRRVHLTGNTTADALHAGKPNADTESVLRRWRLRPGGFILMTLHRQENVDSAANFREVLAGVAEAARRTGLPVVWPVHPRAQRMMRKYRLRPPQEIRTLPPLGYFDFLGLESRARLVISDSGGIQEEACLLRVPMVTIGNAPICWVETIQVGANTRAGIQRTKIGNAACRMIRRRRDWLIPYGARGVSRRVVGILSATAAASRRRPGIAQ